MFLKWEDAVAKYPNQWVVFKNPKFLDDFHMKFLGGIFVEAVTSKDAAYDSIPITDDGYDYTFRYTGEETDMIEIKNLHLSKPTRTFDVKVDRSSVLGNPFYMKDESQRNQVCDKYELHFHEQLSADPLFREEVERLTALYRTYGELNLFCWCSPKRCHSETIRRYILKQGVQV